MVSPFLLKLVKILSLDFSRIWWSLLVWCFLSLRSVGRFSLVEFIFLNTISSEISKKSDISWLNLLENSTLVTANSPIEFKGNLEDIINALLVIRVEHTFWYLVWEFIIDFWLDSICLLSMSTEFFFFADSSIRFMELSSSDYKSMSDWAVSYFSK